jgi:UDP-N-acetylglucosamine transferase subunit ALG13
MILATVGMSEFPFDRLLRAIDDLPGGEELIVQTGCSTVRPTNADCHPFLSFDELTSYMQRARAVVAHAGVGSVLLALEIGVSLVVVPRRREYGEAIDDHQALFSRHLEAAHIARVVEPHQLREALSQAPRRHATPLSPLHSLGDEVAHYLEEHLISVQVRARNGSGIASRQRRQVGYDD